MTGIKEAHNWQAGANTDESYTRNEDTNNFLQTLSSEVEKTSKESSDLLNNVYFPNWENKPPELPAIVSINGIGTLTQNNIFSIIASPGAGKSSICEAIISAFILMLHGKESDSLGISISDATKGVIYIDCERTYVDVWNSFSRAARRSGIPYGKELPNVIIAGLRNVPRVEQRKKIIEEICKGKERWLLIIDGAGDTVKDTNEMPEAVESRIWMREQIANNNLSIITTLHPNPKDEKPRGHQGSELCRESESVAIIRKVDDDCRLLTTDFLYGKNRNNGHATTAFRWSENDMMFISADVDAITADKSKKKEEAEKMKAELLAIKLLAPPKALKRTELEKAIMSAEDCADSTADRHVKKMLKYQIIIKHEDGYYRKAV